MSVASKRGLASLAATYSCKHGRYCSMEEVNVGGKNTGNGMFAALYCAIFCMPSIHKSLKCLDFHNASLDPETVQLAAFFILSIMFTGVCGPPEKLSLALVLNVMRMNVKFIYKVFLSVAVDVHRTQRFKTVQSHDSG